MKKQGPTSPETHDGGWRLRSSRHLFRSPWFRLRQDELTLPNEDEITYTVIIDHEDARQQGREPQARGPPA